MHRMSIWSPCVKVCFVDPDAAICVGCFRTLPELAQWTRFSEAERKAIGAELPERKKQYQEKKARPS
jgi:uncharacterized protein